VTRPGGDQSIAALERIDDNTDVKPGNPGQLLQEIAAIAKQRDSASTVVLVAGAGRAAAVNTIARVAGLELLRVDIGSILNQYVDETEKNLAAVFEDAARQGAILFLDEADSLFGERTDAKDGHNRYANLDIDLLLRRIEQFTGLVIIAADAKAPVDHPLLRGLRYIVDLPDLAPSSDQEIVRDNIRAVGLLYFAAMLEELGFFQVVDRIVALALSGTLTIGRNKAGELVQAFASGNWARMSDEERRSFYSRVFGLPGGEDSVAPNREFNELWLSFVAAVGTSAGHETVRRTGRALAANMSLHIQGIGLGLAAELAREVKDATALLSDPDIRSAYGAQDMWQVIDRVAAIELGGARNSRRYRTLAESGRQVFDWLGTYAPFEGDVCPNAELIAACEQWLAAAAVADDSSDVGPS